jgi:hypothetical protein
MAALIFAAIQACTGAFPDINRNPNEVLGTEMERDGYNIGASLIGIQNYVVPTGLYLHQFQEMLSGGAFSGYAGATPEWSSKFATYNPPTDWNCMFKDVIGGFYPNYDQLYAVTDDPVARALANVCRVASMHRITDTYGPIPYSQMRSLAGGSVNENGQFEGALLAAPYDSQENVYKNLLADLNKAIDLLTENRLADASYYAKYDRVYGGSIENWVRFANSLKLRIAMRMSYAAPALARQTAEEAVQHTIGLIASNTQNALLKTDLNPMNEQVNGWNDQRAGADILSYMNGYQDPRRNVYFTLSTFAGKEDQYVGLRSSFTISGRSTVWPCSKILVATSSPLMWMNAAEVAFLKAEGALRGWNMGGSAKDLYNEGITLSFRQYDIAGADTYLNNDTRQPETYTFPVTGFSSYDFGSQSSITIKWNDSDSDEHNLERIITQKWIAIFPLSNEAWAEFRRTGYPKLAPVVENKSGGTVPAGQFIKRLAFPDTEYQQNAANVREAAGFLSGPDNMGTKLWWDKKN